MTRISSYPNPELRGWRLPKDVQKPSIYYRFWRRTLQMWLTTICKVRVFNRHYEPAGGGVVYICNHQSFLDPMLMAYALQRPVNFMARESLFRWPPFRRLIESVHTFPVRRGTADVAALKESMRRLKANGQLAMFAEGTRTSDGRIGPFLPGAAMLCQRAAEWTVPVLIDGAFETWPRTQMLPRPGNIVVRYAPPIPQAEARK